MFGLSKNRLSPMSLRNRRRLVAEFRRGNTVLKSTPNILYIETTNRCNLECVMCPRGMMTRPQVDMDIDLYKSLISQLDPVLTELIVLHSDGEPLMHEKIFEMIDLAKERGLRVMTSTNATMLDIKKAQRLIDSGLDILTIAIDGTTPEVYEKIRKGANYEMVTSNAKNFIELKGAKPPFVIMQMIEMEENRHQTADFMALWSGLKNKKVYPVIKPFTDWFKTHSSVIDNYNYCDRPWFGMVIHSDGIVVPCVHDFDKRYEVGDISRDNIYDIWNSEKIVRLRTELQEGRRSNELCKDCNATSPTKHSWLVDCGLVFFDMANVAKILPMIGYNRPKQY